MSGGGILSLSLLSRGVGEVQKNGHEKVEVLLEPTDYYNLAAERPFTLPALQTATYRLQQDSRLGYSAGSLRDVSSAPLPKTFSTRKGALLLFSEDLALKAKEAGHARRRAGAPPRERLGQGHGRHHGLLGSAGGLFPGQEEEEAFLGVLKTVDDLSRSVLQYGGAAGCKGIEEDDQIHLKFVHGGRETYGWSRQIRPGYSAKRYLSTWTRSWDGQVLQSLHNNGYFTEHPLFKHNLALPQFPIPPFHCDLSAPPQPYRLLKSMLLSGFIFYRMPDSDISLEEDEEDEGTGKQSGERAPGSRRSIRVIRTTADGEREEIRYSQLDRDTQREVLVDLMVKSAVHFALSKQAEIFEDSIAEAVGSKETSDTELQKIPGPKPLPVFDMREAVEEIFEDSIAEAVGSKETSDTELQKIPGPKPLPVFDMREAVEEIFEDSIAEAVGSKETSDTELQKIPGPKPLPVFNMRQAVEAALPRERACRHSAAQLFKKIISA